VCYSILSLLWLYFSVLFHLQQPSGTLKFIQLLCQSNSVDLCYLLFSINLTNMLTYTCKAVGHIENTLTVWTQEYADHSLHAAGLLHSIKMIDNTQQHQRVYHYFGDFRRIWRWHYVICTGNKLQISTKTVYLQITNKWQTKLPETEIVSFEELIVKRAAKKICETVKMNIKYDE